MVQELSLQINLVLCFRSALRWNGMLTPNVSRVGISLVVDFLHSTEKKCCSHQYVSALVESCDDHVVECTEYQKESQALIHQDGWRTRVYRTSL